MHSEQRESFLVNLTASLRGQKGISQMSMDEFTSMLRTESLLNGGGKEVAILLLGLFVSVIGQSLSDNRFWTSRTDQRLYRNDSSQMLSSTRPNFASVGGLRNICRFSRFALRVNASFSPLMTA